MPVRGNVFIIITHVRKLDLFRAWSGGACELPCDVDSCRGCCRGRSDYSAVPRRAGSAGHVRKGCDRTPLGGRGRRRVHLHSAGAAPRRGPSYSEPCRAIFRHPCLAQHRIRRPRPRPRAEGGAQQLVRVRGRQRMPPLRQPLKPNHHFK
ncbi:hypothetical protein T484DRAFT_2782766 [Baffinella frigidus]|nr:hypothetical protein T484DRAFT_2782766 [Cryptophyta sp. CCMP2293]